MPFAIITTDKPGHAHVRDEHQKAHKQYLDTAEAAEFVHNDPFYSAGLFDSITMTPWRKAFFNFERLVEL